MKNLILLLGIIFIGYGAVYAQEKPDEEKEKEGFSIHINSDDEDEDSNIEINIGRDRTDKTVNTRWVMLDLGFSSYDPEQTYRLANGVDPFEHKLWKSTNVNLHLVQQRISLIDHHLNLAYGLTFEFHKYYFDNDVRMLEDEPHVTFEYVPDANWKKNRLNYTYLTVPLMLNFESNPSAHWKSFHFSGGVYGGALLGANFKIKYEGDRDKVKVKDNFNLSKWRYGVRGEIGYGPVTLYGTYGLSELFEEDKNNGYVLNPISFGLIIVPY